MPSIFLKVDGSTQDGPIGMLSFINQSLELKEPPSSYIKGV
jgi:hypothetical protein